MNGKTLLIVDDEIWIRRKLVSRYDWKRFGIEHILEAEDGEKALALLRAHPVDIVLTDMDMPFMDGAALMQAIRSEFPSVRVIVLSGYSDFPTVHGAIVGGAVDYLLKPVQEAQLYAVLKRMFSGEPASAFGTDDDDDDVGALAAVKAYIDQYYWEELSLTALSERFARSQSYLSRSFKRAYGVNLIAYITDRRMEAARVLLDEGRLSIAQIAAAVGYADYAYFSNLFRRRHGCSPKEYQKNGAAR